MFSTNPARRGKNVRSSYKPSICVLEDRTVPSGFRFFGPPPPGPATHLLVEAPYSVKADVPFYVEVLALDGNDRLASGYTGTIAFSLGTTDAGATVAGATLPADYTFTATDRGIHFFDVTLTVTGAQTITAGDTTTASITGSAKTTVKAAPTATSFIVEAPQYAEDGGPVTVTVIALDQYHHVLTGYTGTVQITSSDGAADLPADFAFTAADDGIATFQVTFNTTGAETITATDTTTASITGHASVNVEAANAVTHFRVVTIGPVTVGGAASVEVIALDANNHAVAGYTGTIAFTSSDMSAVLPANYTFTAADNGRHTFSVTFNTPGNQSLTATDTVTSSITGSADVWVAANRRRFWWGWGNW